MRLAEFPGVALGSIRALGSTIARVAGSRGSRNIGTGRNLGSPPLSGVAVTPDTALTFTAVLAAHLTISTDVATLPLDVVRTRKSGARELATDHDLYAILRDDPNDELDGFRFRQTLMGHTLGWGNSFSEIERDFSGRPLKLHLLPPRESETKADRDDRNRLVYRVNNCSDELSPRDVLHVAGLGYDGITGYTPIGLARQAIGLGMAIEHYAAAFYGNAASPKGALKHPKRLSKEARENLRESFERVHAGPANAHRLAILEEGMEWQAFSISPEDAQYLESRRFQVLEICRIYRIPPHKIGDFSEAHLANLEAANLDYLMTTLAPWLTSIESQGNKKLLTRAERAAGLSIVHDMTALMRGNMAARSAFYQIMRNVGAYSVNDILRAEGMNPLGPEGDTHLAPLSNSTLEAQAAQNKARAGAAPPAGPTPEANPDADPDSDQLPAAA